MSAGFSTLPAVEDHDEWLDPEAAARYLSLREITICRLIKEGELDGVGLPVRVRRQALDAYLERCRIKPGDLPYASQSTGRGEPPPTTKGGHLDRRYGPRYTARRSSDGRSTLSSDGLDLR